MTGRREHITDRIEPLFRGFIPVQDREWYPWTWPSTAVWKRFSKDVQAAFKREVRRLAREDFFFFCDEIMRSSSDPHLDVNVHAEICHLLQNSEEDIGFLIPRNHLKSTICSIAYPVWRLGRNQNLRVLISSDTKWVANAFMRSIRENITGNIRLKEVFPKLKPAKEGGGSNVKKMWSASSILVDRDKLTLKEPSISAMSAGMDLAGTHWDLMLYDDIMTEKNAKNEEVIRGLIEWYEQMVSLRDRITREVFVGTRYRDNDIYGHLMKKGDPPFYVRRVIENDKYIWPDEFNVKRVEVMKRKLSPWVFSCQYYNDPIPPGDAEFEADWISRWNDELLHKKLVPNPPEDIAELRKRWIASLDIYMGCDPSRTEKKYSDYTVIMVVGVDMSGREFVLDFFRKRMQMPSITDKFIEMFKRWDPVNAKIETYGGDIHVYQNIKQKMKEMGMPQFRVKEYDKTPWVKGTDRIRVLQQPMHDGIIYIGSDPKFSELEHELLRFPYGDHDDIITTLAYIHSQQIKPKQQPVEEIDYGSYFLNSVHGGMQHEEAGVSWMSA